MMEAAFRILLLLLAVATLDVGDCSLFQTTLRQRRALLPNATHGRLTNIDHIYTISLPHCSSCVANASRSWAQVFEAQDEAIGDKKFEHVLDPTKPVVFTHRINIPPQACGCGENQALMRRLQALEKEVAALQQRCPNSGCCGSGPVPDCGPHGTYSSSSCRCLCHDGWGGPTCSEALCPQACKPPRGKCVNGSCTCHQGFTGADCSQEICPDDCNDQGRCIAGRCVCFPGYTGHGCTVQTCPGNCRRHGKCIGGVCACDPGYSGYDCGIRDCLRGKCLCKDGSTNAECSTEIPVALRLRMKKILETQATVEWQLPKDKVDGWVISFRPLKEDERTLTHRLAGSRSSFQQTGLASGQEYEVTLQAQKDKKLGMAVTRTFTTMIDSPQNLHVVSATDTTIELGWQKPLAVIDRYRLNYSSATGRRSQTEVPPGDSQAVLTGLEAGVEHTISLVGERGDHRSKAVATRGTTAIDSPRSLRVMAVTDSTITLQWESSVADVSLYRIKYSSKSSRSGELEVSGKDQTATLERLEKGTRYTITLVAEEGKMKSEPVITTATTESVAHRELAGSHSSRALAANGSQSIQDISRAISKRISATAVSTNAGVMARSAVRRYSALARRPLSSPRVLLSSWPLKPKHPPQKGDGAKVEGNQIPATKAQEGPLVGNGRPESPARKVIGPPGSNTMSRGRKDHDGSPGLPTASRGRNKDRRTQGMIPTSSRKAGHDGTAPRIPLPHGSSPGSGPTSGAKYEPTGSPGLIPFPRRRDDLGKSPKTSRIPTWKSERGGPPRTPTRSGGKAQHGAPPGIIPPSSGKRELARSPWPVPGLKGKDKGGISPASKGMQKASHGVQQGSETPPQSERWEATPQEIPGGRQNPEFQVPSSEFLHPPLLHQRSSKPAGVVVWNATSSHAELSWEITGSSFDSLVLGYRDSLTKVAEAEVTLRGTQRAANITGLIVGQSYDLYLYGISLDRPSQPVNVTKITVRGLDIGSTVTKEESMDVQTMPAGAGEEGSEEEEEEEEEVEEEDEDEEGPEVEAQWEKLSSPSITHENLTPSWIPAPFKDPLVESQGFSTSSPYETLVPTDPLSPEQTTPTPDVDQNVTFQVTTDDTLSIPPTASSDRAATLGNVSAEEVTARSLCLSWTVRGGIFNSFLVRYREASGSTRWQEHKVLGHLRSLLLKGLRPGTKYSFLLHGVQRGQRSEPLSLLATTDPLEKTKTAAKLDTFVVSNITDSSFLLAWSTMRRFDSFLIHYRAAGSKDVRKVRVAGDLRSFVITGLKPGTKYTLYLFGISSNQRTKPISSTATTGKARMRLGRLSVLNVTSNSIRLSWTADRTFDSYLIQYRVRGSQETRNVTVAGGKRGYLIVGLRPSTRYTVYLYGTSGSVRTQPLTAHVTTTAASVVAQTGMTNLVVSNVTSNSLQLSWESAWDYNTFLVEYRAAGQEAQSTTVTGNLRSKLLSSLQPATAYTIDLYGLSAGTRSKPLTTVATTEKDQVQPSEAIKPDSLSLSNITTGSFRISWKMKKVFDSFFILYGVQGSEVMRNLSVTGDRRFVVIKDLSPGTAYTIRVYGVSPREHSKPLTAVVTTKVKGKVKPKKLWSLSVSRVSTDSIRLVWKAERGFDAFLVRYKEHISGVTQNVTTDGGRRALTLTDLQPGTKYTVYVHGLVNGQRTRPLSRVIAIPATTGKGPVRLGGVSAANTTATSTHLSWTVDRTFDSYLIQYRVQGTQEIQNITVAGGKRGYLIVGLRPSTRYTIYLYGIFGLVRTQPLTTHITTTASEDKDSATPERLGSLSPPIITANSIRLSWTPNRTFDSYVIQYRVHGMQETQNVTVAGGKRGYLIVGLRPSTRYTIYLYGITGSVRTQPITTHATTTATEDKVPVTPERLGSLSPPIVTANSIRLSWTPDRTFDSYLIQFRVHGTQETQNITVAGGKRGYLIVGLQPSTRYTIYLYGITGSVSTQPLTTHATTTASEDKVPATAERLGSLSPPIVTANSIRLSWTPDRTFDSYLIQYREQGTQETRNVTVAGGKRGYLIMRLRPSTRYTVYVYGIKGSVHSQPLTAHVTTTASEEKVPMAPVRLGSLSPPNVTPTSIRLSWTPDRTFDSYLIQYRVQGSQETRNITVAGGKRGYLIGGLRPITRYTSEDKVSTAPVSLGKLSPPNVTPTSIRLSWTPYRTFNSYLIQYRVRGSQETRNITVAGGKRGYLIGGLRPSTRYTVYLYGISGSVRTQPLTAHITTPASEDKVPAAPVRLGRLLAPNVTANSIHLSWTPDRTFDSYLIQYRVRGSQEIQNITVAGEKRGYLIMGLRPSTRYTVYLYGISGSVRTLPLTTHITTTASEDKVPATAERLGSLSPPIVTANSIRLSWTPDRTFDSYLIQYRVQGTQETRNVTVAGGKRGYHIMRLRPSTRYTIYVYGIKGSVHSQPLTAHVTTTASEDKVSTAPVSLGKLSPPNVTPTSIRLSWTPYRTFNSYLIQYRVPGSQETRNITVAGGKRGYLIGGLRPSTRYTVYLYGISGSVRTQPLTAHITTPASEDKVPAAPVRLGSLLAPNVTANSVHLSWTPDRTFDSYLIQYRVRGSQEIQNITVAGEKRGYLIMGLRPSTRYTVYLYGISGSVRTLPLTTHITTTASEGKVPDTPVRLGRLSAPKVTANSVHLSWTPDRTFDSYLIQYRVRGSQKTRNVTVAGGKRGYLIVGLQPSTRYTIYLYGISGSVRTQPLTTHITTTASEEKVRETPVRLGRLSAPSVTSNSIRLSWTVDRTFDSYLIQYKVHGTQEIRNVTVAGGKRGYLIVGLRPSTKYTIYLYGISGSVRTQPLTTHITTTASEDKVPVVPVSLSPPNITANSIRLSWTPHRTYESYLIQYRVQGMQEIRNVTVAGSKRGYLIVGLQPSTKYIIYLYGISGSVRTQPLTSQITTTASQEKVPETPVRLGRLSAPSITANSIRLSWTADRTFDSYLIQYRVRGSQETQNVTVAGGKRGYLIVGLRPSTRYTIYLYGILGSVRTQPLTTHITTTASAVKEDRKPMAVPSLYGVSVSRVTGHSLELSWTAGGTFDSFLIQYGVKGSADVSNLTVTGEQRSTAIRGLRPRVAYTLRVHGLSDSQLSRPLGTVTHTTASTGDRVTKPSESAELGALSALVLSPSSVRLSWPARRDFDSFIVQYWPQGSEVMRKVTVKGSSQSYTIAGLSPNSKYTFHLYGVSGGRRSAPSSATVSTKDVPESASPTRPGVSNIKDDSFQISWTVERVFQFFLIQYRAHGSYGFQNLTVPSDRRSYYIAGLRPSTRYIIYLYGVHRMQLTKLMALIATTAASKVKEGPRPAHPQALGALSVSNITADSLELSWTGGGRFDSYIIQYRAQDSERVQKIRLAGSRHSYVILGLRPTTKYVIYIRGVSRGRQTEPLSIAISTTASVDTNGVRLSRLNKLIRLSGNNVTENSLQVSWAAESGFDSFLIQYRAEGSTETQNITAAADQQSALISGLRPATAYQVSLYGLSDNRRTKPLTTVVTTAASVEQVTSSMFGSLSFSNITANSFKLSWEADNAFESFLIEYIAQGTDTRYNLTVPGNRRSAFVTGIKPATNYTIYLYGVSEGRLSRPLAAHLTIKAIPVHSTSFSTLGGLSVSDISSHGLRLSWTVEQGQFDLFLVRYWDSRGRLASKEVIVPGNRRDISISDLIPSTEYQLSLSGIVDGRQTDPIPITAQIAGVSQRELRFTDINDTSVTISWAAGSDPVDTYKIFYVPMKRGEPRSRSVNGRRTNITLSSLVPGTQYEVNLVPVRGQRERPPIVGGFTTAPDSPSHLKAINISETKALLVWRPATAPIDHYVISYKAEGVPAVNKTVSSDSVQQQLEGLHANTAYTAVIYSVQGGRRSSDLTASFTTGSEQLNGLLVSDISSTEALVSWDGQRAGVTGYLLLYGIKGDKAQQVTTGSRVTSHRLRKLHPVSRYTVRLHGLRDGERLAPSTAHFTTAAREHIPFPKDCAEELTNGRTESGVVTLYLKGNKEKPIRVLCDMATDGGGWIVFQRRINGKVNFMRPWKDYVTGFGAVSAEHWLGLENLHQLTSQERYELRVDLRAGQESAYATYDNFVVEDVAMNYQLGLGKYAGTAGNSLSYHRGSNFTTIDMDNDEALTNCAISYRGGWWYRNCHRVNLNGEYGNNKDHQGVNWYGWKGFEFSIPSVEMKMRPLQSHTESRKP